jgi:hypothetical protein
MSNEREKLMQIGAWSLGALVCLIAILAWGPGYDWRVLPFSAYVLFPLLGLLAFSLMWTHYVLGTIRELAGVKPEVLKSYYHYTGWAVLFLICLHPGLLIGQLFLDGAGLPPLSYERYVAPGLGWVTLLGSVSLLVFLAFELHRFFGKKSWWHYVVDASDFAMLAIVYHGLRLGTDLNRLGWFRTVWWFYAVTLVAVLLRKYYLRFRPKTKVNPVN